MIRNAFAALGLASALLAPASAGQRQRGPDGVDIASRAPDHADVAYAPADPAGSSGHLLDLYLPAASDGRPAPVLIWTAGSAWRSDRGKERAGWLVNTLVPQGYAIAAVSVRSSAQARYPAQLHDIKAAIRWLRANAVRLKIDPDRIGIIGTSSGAWVASMAATTGGNPALEGAVGTTGPSSAVQAAVALWPPSDLLSMDKDAIEPCDPNRAAGPGTCHDSSGSPESTLIGCALQSCPDRARAASPVTHATRNAAPILIIHGQRDRLVPHDQGLRLFQSYRLGCASATFVSVPKLGHGPFPLVLTNPNLAAGATTRTTSACKESKAEPATLDATSLTAFLDRHLKR